MRKMLVIIAFCVALIALVAVITRKEHQVRVKTEVATVEKDIRDHLPIGSSRAQVEAYLDQRKIEHSYIGELKGDPDYEYTHTETAVIPNESEKSTYRSIIQILFKFDDTDSKLIKYSVREIVKGP